MRIFRDWLQNVHEKPDDEPVRWRVGAYGLLENEKGEWLMVQSAMTGKMDLPGGGVEIDESIPEGAKREFYEETGYRVEVDGMPIYLGENDLYHDGARQFMHVLIITYRVRLMSDQRDADAVNKADGYEISDMRWVDPATLTEEQVQPIHWPFVRMMLRNDE